MTKLYLTFCSAKKYEIEKGVPKDLYDSKRISLFIKTVEQQNLKYAILSGKYGIVLSDKVIEDYDTMMPTEKDNPFEYAEMSDKLQTQLMFLIPKVDFNEIVFYVPNEYRAKRYIQILSKACEHKSVKLTIVNKIADIHSFSKWDI